MALNKAKSILLEQARKLSSKAEQKRREADRLKAEAAELLREADKL